MQLNIIFWSEVSLGGPWSSCWVLCAELPSSPGTHSPEPDPAPSSLCFLAVGIRQSPLLWPERIEANRIPKSTHFYFQPFRCCPDPWHHPNGNGSTKVWGAEKAQSEHILLKKVESSTNASDPWKYQGLPQIRLRMTATPSSGPGTHVCQ